jgi:hypothetical protein
MVPIVNGRSPMQEMIQRDNDALFGLDPVYYEEMVDPVIDQLGHTFDRRTIDALAAITPEGEDILCPIGREVINVDRLVPNLLAKDAIERVNRANALAERAQPAEEVVTRELMEQIAKFMQDSLEAQKKSKDAMKVLTDEVRILRMQHIIMRKQHENIVKMGFRDKIITIFDCSNAHLRRVMDRGISNAEKRMLLQ